MVDVVAPHVEQQKLRNPPLAPFVDAAQAAAHPFRPFEEVQFTPVESCGRHEQGEAKGGKGSEEPRRLIDCQFVLD